MTQPFAPSDPARFAAALRGFDQANAQDPNQLEWQGRQYPRELLYARWLSDWILRLCPQASEALRLAARSQHICRWEIPRSSYPMTRAGYLRWRGELKKFHAQKTGELLSAAGYPEDVVARVQALNLKKGFPNDPEGRVLEDALCLVFLEHQFAELVARTSQHTMLQAVKKVWNKMTPTAQAIARGLAYGPNERALLQKALGVEG